MIAIRLFVILLFIASCSSAVYNPSALQEKTTLNSAVPVINKYFNVPRVAVEIYEKSKNLDFFKRLQDQLNLELKDENKYNLVVSSAADFIISLKQNSIELTGADDCYSQSSFGGFSEILSENTVKFSAEVRLATECSSKLAIEQNLINETIKFLIPKIDMLLKRHDSITKIYQAESSYFAQAAVALNNNYYRNQDVNIYSQTYDPQTNELLTKKETSAKVTNLLGNHQIVIKLADVGNVKIGDILIIE